MIPEPNEEKCRLWSQYISCVYTREWTKTTILCVSSPPKCRKLSRKTNVNCISQQRSLIEINNASKEFYLWAPVIYLILWFSSVPWYDTSFFGVEIWMYRIKTPIWTNTRLGLKFFPWTAFSFSLGVLVIFGLLKIYSANSLPNLLTKGFQFKIAQSKVFGPTMSQDFQLWTTKRSCPFLWVNPGFVFTVVFFRSHCCSLTSLRKFAFK